MDYLEWARKNKKPIAREFVRKIEYVAHEKPVGIFTAGLPGAGKTEFTQELLKNLVDPPLRIDLDEIAQLIEGYSPMKANLFRSAASIILARIYDEITKAGFDFVFDGTFAHDNALKNLERAISHRYTAKIYYIHQVPEVAWRFTKDRELVEKRSIERSGFIETYHSLYRNLSELQDKHKNVTISVIIKTDSNKVGEIVENVDNIYDIIPHPLDHEQLEHAIVE